MPELVTTLTTLLGTVKTSVDLVNSTLDFVDKIKSIVEDFNKEKKFKKKILFPVDPSSPQGLSIPCILKGGKMRGRLDGEVEIRSYQDINLSHFDKDSIYNKGYIEKGFLFWKGTFVDGKLNGNVLIRNIDKRVLYQGNFSENFPSGFSRVSIYFPILNRQKKIWCEGLYIGNCYNGIPHGRGSISISINVLFTNPVAMSKFHREHNKNYPSPIDNFEKYETDFSFFLSNNGLGGDVPFLDTAISVRKKVNFDNKLTIPATYYPFYVGDFKNGEFDGEGILSEIDDFSRSYYGVFKNDEMIKRQFGNYTHHVFDDKFCSGIVE